MSWTEFVRNIPLQPTKFRALLALAPLASLTIAWPAHAQTATPEWVRVSGQNGTFNIEGTRTVRYGAGASWRTRAMTGPGQWCTNAFFGGDPAPGVAKSCEVQALPATSNGSWAKVASQNGPFNVTGTRTVRFGAAPNWVSRSMTGPGQWCTVAFFGRDPAPGQAKACEVFTAGTTPNPPSMPKGIGIPLYSGFNAGSNAVLLSPGESPRRAIDGTGNFRTVCAPVSMGYFDPIVFPGEADASHLHTFLGNTAVHPGSTPESLRASGNSACRGGTINRSSYWVPSMVDTRTNGAVMPRTANIYYKSGYLGVRPQDVVPFPAGMRIIAGDPRNTTADPYVNRWHFTCHSAGTRGQSIQNCAVGDEMVQVIEFPQCWDGRNVDSPDHQSHMAYATGSGCPSTHPVPLPEITYNIHYPITQANQARHWRLSSDNPAAPAGYSSHADWINGWDVNIMKTWVERCINPGMDCGSHMLGNGMVMGGLD